MLTNEQLTAIQDIASKMTHAERRKINDYTELAYAGGKGNKGIALLEEIFDLKIKTMADIWQIGTCITKVSTPLENESDANCARQRLNALTVLKEADVINPITAIRLDRGLTQKALAEKIGMNLRQYQKIESGEIRIENLSAKNFIALMGGLGFDVAQIKTLL